MCKRFFIAVMAFFVTLGLCSASFAADKKAAAPAKATAPVKVPAKRTTPKANFGMVTGTITSIDTTNAAEVKLNVKNDSDGSVRVVTITPWTNITKVTDASELKTGEQVRMMTRKVNDKDVAMGVMFGKVKNIPAPAKTAAANTAPAATPKK
ncbi:MAG: hypothetical protein WCY36_03275 [Candidatus Omnitrophota bacterium]